MLIGDSGMEEQQEASDARHLTSDQREDILGDLAGATAGPPVSMVAEASDKEAIGYEGEIASVLEDMGCKVEIDNVKADTPAEAIPTGVEMTIKEETVRPIHANRIMGAFRRAGVAIATRINAGRGKNNTLYITVGANDPPPELPGKPVVGSLPSLTGTTDTAPSASLVPQRVT
jgi:hypothetical protein